MRPGARLKAGEEILEDILVRHRPASIALADWGKHHRFAGSGDRAAIGTLVYDALRRRKSIAARMGSDAPRALVLGAALPAVADEDQDNAALTAAIVAATVVHNGAFPVSLAGVPPANIIAEGVVLVANIAQKKIMKFEIHIDQPQIGFVHQRCRLQRVAGTLIVHMPLREASQLGVQEWHDFFKRCSVAILPGLQ